MEFNVFGNPITDETLKGMPEFAGRKITSKDRAQIALKMKNAGGKETDAHNFANSLKDKWGNGNGMVRVMSNGNEVVTIGKIYNSTGNPLKFVTSHDYAGQVAPSSYPKTIENGQWFVFKHTETLATTGSSAAIVYSGQNTSSRPYEWMMAWDDKGPLSDSNKAYTEIRAPAPYDDKRWNEIYANMSKGGSQGTDQLDGCLSYVSISRSYFDGTMTTY